MLGNEITRNDYKTLIYAVEVGKKEEIPAKSLYYL